MIKLQFSLVKSHNCMQTFAAVQHFYKPILIKVKKLIRQETNLGERDICLFILNWLGRKADACMLLPKKSHLQTAFKMADDLTCFWAGTWILWWKLSQTTGCTSSFLCHQGWKTERDTLVQNVLMVIFWHEAAKNIIKVDERNENFCRFG